MTLNQRLTNKAKKQLIAANKICPATVAGIRKEFKEVQYVHQLSFLIGCEFCTYVLNSHISSSLVFDAFKRISE